MTNKFVYLRNHARNEIVSTQELAEMQTLNRDTLFDLMAQTNLWSNAPCVLQGFDLFQAGSGFQIFLTAGSAVTTTEIGSNGTNVWPIYADGDGMGGNINVVFDDANPTLDRIDAVVLRPGVETAVDPVNRPFRDPVTAVINNNPVPTYLAYPATVYVIHGVPGAGLPTVTAPDVYLYAVTIPHGATDLNASNVADHRQYAPYQWGAHSPSDTGVVTNHNDKVVMASATARAIGTRGVVLAAETAQVGGTDCAAVAASGVEVGGLATAALASVGSIVYGAASATVADEGSDVNGSQSASVAGANNLIEGTDCAALAATNATIPTTTRAATIASDKCIPSGGRTLLLGLNAELAQSDAVAGGYDAGTQITHLGANQNLKWQLDNAAGNGAFAGHLSSGADANAPATGSIPGCVIDGDFSTGGNLYAGCNDPRTGWAPVSGSFPWKDGAKWGVDGRNGNTAQAGWVGATKGLKVGPQNDGPGQQVLFSEFTCPANGYNSVTITNGSVTLLGQSIILPQLTFPLAAWPTVAPGTAAPAALFTGAVRRFEGGFDVVIHNRSDYDWSGDIYVCYLIVGIYPVSGYPG